MKLATAERMRELDRLTIETVGIPGLVLMENAGRGATDLLLEYYADACEAGVAILCGPGNNGGDGFVVARHLQNRGYACKCFLLGEKQRMAGDARVNLEIAEKIGIHVHELLDARDLETAEDDLGEVGVVVDALFGTGLTRPIAGLGAELIELVNELDAAVVAVDIPSGLGADDGRPTGPVIRADLTCTFGLAKVGQFLYPGRSYCGVVEVVDITIPRSLVDAQFLPCELLEEDLILPFFAPRSPETHKGDFGHVLVVGGSRGMSGAPLLAARAAVLSGAGLVTAAVPAPVMHAVEAGLVEALKVALPADYEGRLSAAALDSLLERMAGKTAVALGPGLGRGQDLEVLLAALVAQAKIPLVIDADGLNNLAGDLALLKKARAPLVLTPHPGEMARLLGKTNAEVQADRPSAAADLAQATEAVVVLKGAGTLVAAPDGRWWINSTGNPGMASGGMGDVLTGMIASFIAQGVPPLDAALCGVYLHGLAGDLAAETVGERALSAAALLDRVPEVIRAMEAAHFPPESGA